MSASKNERFSWAGLIATLLLSAMIILAIFQRNCLWEQENAWRYR